MWMGGTVPLGYRVQDRKLVVSEPEASFVRRLFSRYLELKSVLKFAAEVSWASAEASNATPDQRENRDCTDCNNDRLLRSSEPALSCDRYRSRPMSPGILGKLLANPIYIGQVRHKGEVYDGEHEPLMDADLFSAVRKQLALGAPVPKGTMMHGDTHLLTGILFDDTGDRMSPTHGRTHGRRYRYYVSGRVRRSSEPVPDSWRIPARKIEKIVRNQAIRILQDHGMIASWIEAYASSNLIELGPQRTNGLIQSLSEQEPVDRQRSMLNLMFRSVTLSTSVIHFKVQAKEIVSRLVGDSLDADQLNAQIGPTPDESVTYDDDGMIVELPIILRRRGNGMRIVIDSPYAQPEPDPSLVDLIARAHIYLQRLTGPSAINTSSIASTFNV